MHPQLHDSPGRSSVRSTGLKAVGALLAGAIVIGAMWVWLSSSDFALVQELQARWADLRGGSSAAGDDLAATASVVTIDSAETGTFISPLIYGVAFADTNALSSLGATVNRWGGNTATTYNWVNHSWNAARDWEFRNKPGPDADTFVTNSLDGGAAPLITIPTIGYVARNGDNGTQSRGVPAGGGPALAAGSVSIAGYDPSTNQLLTSVESFARKPSGFVERPAPGSSPVYQDEWVHHLIDRFGSGSAGVRYFAMDNEPDIWSSTHTDIHPTRMGYDDMIRNFEEYATAIKAVDPSAVILGPDLCCWTSLFYSDLDRGGDNYRTHGDRTAHDGEAFVPWWLQQVARLDQSRGRRTLDLLDVHYYPQAAGVYSDRADPFTQALRIRSVRSLWDPNYVDESWIGTDVELIPRLQSWIGQSYPGTGLAISEYNFGGEKDASGAVAEAEALGVFGHDGVTLATYWTVPAIDSPVAGAFRIYRNFDGKGASFGQRSLPAQSDAPNVRAYAARHPDTNEIDTVLVNESLSTSTAVSLDFKSGALKTTGAYCLNAGSSAIVQMPTDSTSPLTLKPLSICIERSVPR